MMTRRAIKGSTAVQKALEIGLISEELQLSGNALKRDACAKISYDALGTNLKDTETALAEKLVADGTLTEKAVQKSGVLHKLTYIPFSGENRIKCADFAALVSGPVGWVDFAGTMTDYAPQKFQQSDWSPETLALSCFAVREYCGGKSTTVQSPWNWKPKANDEWVFYAGPAHYDWLTVLGKEAHLIGYAMVPPSGYKDGRLPFVSCYVDVSEEIEQLRQDCVTQYQNAVEFKTDALRTETVTTFFVNNAGQTVERSIQSLFIDPEKLPESLKDYKYFALFDQRNGSKENKVREVWFEIQADFLLDSADYSPMQTSGQTVSGRFLGDQPDDVLMLFDENRVMLGYCMINRKLPDTEAIVES